MVRKLSLGRTYCVPGIVVSIIFSAMSTSSLELGTFGLDDGCGNQVDVFSKVTPRYLPFGFYLIGMLLKCAEGGMLRLRRRMNKTFTLSEGFIDIF